MSDYRTTGAVEVAPLTYTQGREEFLRAVAARRLRTGPVLVEKDWGEIMARTFAATGVRLDTKGNPLPGRKRCH